MTKRQEPPIEQNMLVLSQEAFEVGLEAQMAMMEGSARWGAELSSFMARRSQATLDDVKRIVSATSPDEVVSAQLNHMTGIMADCTEETGRLLDITEQVTREAATGLRSSLRGRWGQLSE